MSHSNADLPARSSRRPNNLSMVRISVGTPINDVADILGHSRLDITRIYEKARE